MTKKDMKEIEKVVLMERECGHILCDFDDYNHDLAEIADCIGVDYHYDEDSGDVVFNTIKQETRVKEALNYYYDLH